MDAVVVAPASHPLVSAGEGIDVLDLHIRKRIDKLHLGIRKGVHHLPHTALVGEGLDLNDSDIGKCVNNLNFHIRKCGNYLNLAV